MSTQNRRPFGKMETGEEVELLSLTSGPLSCEIITYGASLRTLCVPDRAGNPVDVVLGYDTLQEYTSQGGHFGACVGRYANRIAGGKFTLDGETYSLFLNNGPNHLHGGKQGFSKRVWTVETLEKNFAVLSIDSPDGDQSYPGHLRLQVSYILSDNALTLRYQASVEGKATVVNLTNHTYFNLSGHSSGPVTEQEIQLFASRYTPADKTGIPTGEIAEVAGTPMDLTAPGPIGAKIHDPFPQLAQFGGYDHNFVLDGEAGTMRRAARAKSGVSGIVLEAWTDQPGMQFFTANTMAARPGKNGASYGPFHGFCLETQHYPDSPNQPDFPSTVLNPGDTFESTTSFEFAAE